MDGCIVRCGIISSSQLAATSEIVKRFWPRVSHVSSAIASSLRDFCDLVQLLLVAAAACRKLKVLASEFLITSTGKGSISKLTIPGHLYSTLLAEAARYVYL